MVTPHRKSDRVDLLTLFVTLYLHFCVHSAFSTCPITFLPLPFGHIVFFSTGFFIGVTGCFVGLGLAGLGLAGVGF